MSKKSRRRNKKILAALALAGGAALMGRGVKGNVSKTAAMEDANIGTNVPIGGTDHIKKAILPVSKPVIGNTGNTITRKSGIKISPSGQKIGAGGVNTAGHSRGVLAKLLQRGAMNKVPPSMRGGARHAAGWTPGVHTGNINQFAYRAKGGSAYKKGGRVTGIAKRGFGRALMKGKK